MLKRPFTLLVLSLPLIFVSCNSSADLPDAVGKPGSLVIVADDGLHKSLQASYDSLFLEPGSSQPPFFEILKPGIEDFQRFYFNQRTILVLVTKDQVSAMPELLETFDKETINKLLNHNTFVLKTREDVFARHQHIAYVFGNTASDIRRKLLAGKLPLTHVLMNLGVEDLHAEISSDTLTNDAYYREMKKAFGIGVKIPDQFKFRGKTKNAWYFQSDEKDGSAEKSIGMVVHAYPYKDSTDFSYISIRTVRDTISKYLIKGEIPGTYMGTSESEAYPAVTMEQIQLNGKKGVKLRGWWTIRGMSMAGPYLRYVVLEPSSKYLFAFEGFVYRPELKTRESEFRLIEAIALGIQ
jgi:hypothetical protein